jgi:hypothetical protein
MPEVLTVAVVKTSYLALKYSSKKLIFFILFYFQVTNPPCASQLIYFLNLPSCNNTTAGRRIQQCTQQKFLAANVDEILHSCTYTFSRHYIVFITKFQPRLIYGHRKNVPKKTS